MPRYSGFLLSCCPFPRGAAAGARYVAILAKCRPDMTPKRERSSLTGKIKVVMEHKVVKRAVFIRIAINGDRLASQDH
jgi:hypothetical protein